MEIFDFTTNWNYKLGCQIFTTLRLSGRIQVGQIVEIRLNAKDLGIAKCVAKYRLDLTQLTDPICWLDTGQDALSTRKILKQIYTGNIDWETQPVFYYILSWVQTTGHQKALPAAKQMALF